MFDYVAPNFARSALFKAKNLDDSKPVGIILDISR